MTFRFLLTLVMALYMALTLQLAHANEAAPLADDPVAEKRLQSISSELRCLVCQNETIAGSNAELAVDLRREIRNMIHAGKSDQQIIDFMVTRYGDFVLYRPPFKSITLLLWLGPLLFLVVGIFSLQHYLKRRNRTLQEFQPLSEEEGRKADALLGNTPPEKP